MKKSLLTLLMMLAVKVNAASTQIQINQEQIDNLAIQTGPLQVSSHIPLLQAPARVVVPAQHEALISSPQPGLLTQLQVNSGDNVKAGQIVAYITSPELVALQQQFLTTTSELNLSSQERQRDQHLLQEGVIAERRWQETQAVHASKSARIDEAKQLLLMAGMTPADIATLVKTRRLNNQLAIRAPISGVVLERMATLGARLDLQAPLYRLADLSELWLEINIPQQRMGELRLGDGIESEEGLVSGKLILLGQSVTPENQTVSVRARVERSTTALRVGQNLNIRLMQSGSDQSFQVPTAAIAQNGGHHYIFVRNAQGFAVTEVTVLGKQNESTLIRGELNGTEHIALQGSVALKANWLGLGGSE